MNNGGTPGGGRTIVGFFIDMENTQHGYLVKDGMLAAYDPDGADLTAIWDINSSGQFVGAFRYPTDLATKRHGFLKDPDSLAPIQLDFTCEKLEGCAGAPMHTVAFTTSAFGVNSGGVVVGQYLDRERRSSARLCRLPPGRRPDDGTGLNPDPDARPIRGGLRIPSNVITRPTGRSAVATGGLVTSNTSVHSSSSQPRSAYGRGARRARLSPLTSTSETANRPPMIHDDLAGFQLRQRSWLRRWPL